MHATCTRRIPSIGCPLLLALLAVTCVAATAPGQSAAPARPSIQIPAHFVENAGQYPAEVAYAVKGQRKTLFFARASVHFVLHEPGRGGKRGPGRDRDAGRDCDAGRDWAVRLDFVGGDAGCRIEAPDRTAAVYNYFRGAPRAWRTGVRTFSRIVYRDLWPGIDLEYRAAPGGLKYAYLVAPGADPERIRFRYTGASSVKVTADGSLRIATPAGAFEDAAPTAHQEIDGRRVPVSLAFKPATGGAFGFRVGDHDSTRPIVLDPAVIIYSGYIGGASTDRSEGIAVDKTGHVYVAGTALSDSATFPVKVGPRVVKKGQAADVFVAKLNPAGTALIYCGFIGGSSHDWATDLAIDAAGNAYVCGYTDSDETTFPVTVGPDLTFNRSTTVNGSDAFVARVNASGKSLDYCGYIGGESGEWATSIAVDGQGQAYVCGWTTNDQKTFPVKVGPDLTYNGLTFADLEGFVAKVNATGSGLIYCGYIGGASSEQANAIDVDASGRAYVTGYTWSDEKSFPVKGGPDLTYNGKGDAFVARVNAAGTQLDYCGYLGGSELDRGQGIAVDAASCAYLTGAVHSDDKTFPVHLGPDVSYNSPGPAGGDGFVAKLDATGKKLIYCGYIGGSAADYGYAIDVDALGNAYVIGGTLSSAATFPVLRGPGLKYSSNVDVFVARVHRTGAALEYCGYMGGLGRDLGLGIAVDGGGTAYVCGEVALGSAPTFPVRTGPDLTFNGGYDAFVAKVAFATLAGSGIARPGSTVSLRLTLSDSVGLPYAIGSSLGLGPIVLGARQIRLSPDDLLRISVQGEWPAIFSGYVGILDPQGEGFASIRIPGIAALVGVDIHSAGVSLDPTAPFGIRSISDPFSFRIQP